MKRSYAINNLDDLETIIPEKVPDLPDCYYFPDDKRLCGSIDGKVWNVKTRKIINGCLHKPSGSVNIHITTNSTNRSVYKLHRIVARIFVGRPTRHLSLCYSKLEVNHIDGNRTNNIPSNLEWVIGSENQLHARRSGLCSYTKRVLARHLETNQIITFMTMRECAEHFKISSSTLHKHLTKGKVGLYQKDLFVFKWDDGSEWKKYPLHLIKELGLGLERICVLVKCLKTDQKIIFETVKEAAKHTQIQYVKLYLKLKEESSFSSNGFYYQKLYSLTDC